MQIGYIGGAVAGAAAGVQAVFEYNQKNFKYDREMRQKTEFKTREWRNAQCDLWRDDVREIIGLTEKKMDSYLVIGTLQLGMSVVLFCEGRLEPGTPPWLMHMYMMAIVGAFMYLLMAVWLAMHASIVAQCSEVRLLTQFIRRPIPTWEELQDMRTFAQCYEHLESGQVMRVPFTGTAKPDQDHARGETTSAFGAPFGSSRPSSTVGALPSADAAERAIDPWFKEAHAEDRQGMYELMQMPIERRRHIYLARRSAAQYQAFDAFTRTALSCGTHQLLSAVAYYCIGYCSIQDGAPWPAYCVAFVMVAASVAIAQLDLSMTRRQQNWAVIMLVAGPLLSATMAWACAVKMPFATPMVYVVFPVATVAHAGWLLFSLQVLDVQKQENGSYLPTKFRAVLYLDVFGWFSKGQPSTSPASKRSMDYFKLPGTTTARRYSSMAGEFEVVPQAEEGTDSEESISLSELQDSLREEIRMWSDDKVWPHLDAEERRRVQRCAGKYTRITGEGLPPSHAVPVVRTALTESALRPWLKMSGYGDTGKEAPYLFQPDTGEVIHIPEAADGQVLEQIGRDLPEDIRELSMVEADLEVLESERDRFRGQRAKAATAKRPALSIGPSEIIEYAVGDDESSEEGEDQSLNEVSKRREGVNSYSPGGKRAQRPENNKLHGEPEEDVVVGYGDLKPGVVPWQIFWRATVVLAISWVLGAWLPLFLCREMLVKGVKLIGGEMGVSDGELDREVHEEAQRVQRMHRLSSLDLLPGGHLVETVWPSHSGFQPRALSCDPLGLNIVVADDFGLYAAELNETRVQKIDDGNLRGREGPGKDETKLVARFLPQPHCTAIEGHGLQDVSVACVHGQNSSKHCRAMVLHEQGCTLSECDLRLQSPLPAKQATGPTEDLPSWDITRTWLSDDDEYVTSAAVSSRCLKPITRMLKVGLHTDHKVTGEFKPQVMDGGCVVVGTSRGRIIELRTHYFNHTQLVPEMAMRQWSDPVSQGALHVLNNGVVVAIRDGSSVGSFDVTSGKRVGEWRLPEKLHIQWAHICGGGDSLFILGHAQSGEARLFRFRMPQEIQDWPGEDVGAENRKLEI